MPYIHVHTHAHTHIHTNSNKRLLDILSINVYFIAIYNKRHILYCPLTLKTKKVIYRFVGLILVRFLVKKEKKYSP
jgi:hypothetical protein